MEAGFRLLRTVPEHILRNARYVHIDSSKLPTQDAEHESDMAIIVTKHDHTFVFGNNIYGRLGFSEDVYPNITEIINSPLMSNKQFKSFLFSDQTLLLWNTDGRLYITGYRLRALTGSLLPDHAPKRFPLGENKKIKKALHTPAGICVLTKTGDIVLYDGEEAHTLLTRQNLKLTDFIFSSGRIFAIVSNGEVVLWDDPQTLPSTITFYPRDPIKKIVSSLNHYVMLSSSGKVYTGGHNRGALGHSPDDPSIFIPTIPDQLEHKRFIDVSTAGHANLSIFQEQLSNNIYVVGNVNGNIALLPTLFGRMSVLEFLSSIDHGIDATLTLTGV